MKQLLVERQGGRPVRVEHDLAFEGALILVGERLSLPG
jgi:hypothetical protein